MNRLVVGVLKGLALAVVAAAMSGCCCGKRSLKGPISPSVAVPGNRLWSSAAVLWNTYESGSHTISSNCDHVLQLKGPSGERELSLSSWSPPNPGYHTCKNASYQLVVAPDGHGVAVSADGAKWQWIMLDAGDQPTLIKDGSFAASASDVLAKVPATSAFMRELLAKAERGESEAADVMRNPAFLHHLNGAIAWCCGPANDTVARTSLVRFAVSATGPGKKSRFGDTLTLELGDCVGDIAKSDPSLLPLLIAPLHDKPDASCSESPEMDIAALAWSRIGTTQGQVEIAEHLARHVATGHSCNHAHRFWALARLTSQLKSATPGTMELLLASASNAVPGKSPDGLISDEVSSSLRALAALRDPRGDEILRKAQRTDGCSGMPDQLPPFVHPMKDYNPLYHEKTLGKEDFRSWPRCWAALALRSRH